MRQSISRGARPLIGEDSDLERTPSSGQGKMTKTQRLSTAEGNSRSEQADNIVSSSVPVSSTWFTAFSTSSPRNTSTESIYIATSSWHHYLVHPPALKFQLVLITSYWYFWVQTRFRRCRFPFSFFGVANMDRGSQERALRDYAHPPIEASEYEINPVIITMLQTWLSFGGAPSENPYEHISRGSVDATVPFLFKGQGQGVVDFPSSEFPHNLGHGSAKVPRQILPTEQD